MTDRMIGSGIYTTVTSRGERTVSYEEFWCSLDSCSLDDRGECINDIYGYQCPHGYRTVEASPKKRAKSWITRKKEAEKATPDPPRRPHKILAFIGDYVWLPYESMEQCEGITLEAAGQDPWSRQGGFLKKEDFNADVVVRLAEMRARSTFGSGEYLGYQQETVPRFLHAVKYKAPDVWAEVLEKRPNIAERLPTFRSIGLPAKLLPIGKTAGATVRGCMVLSWNGEQMKIKGYCGIPKVKHTGSVEILFTPTDDTWVVVTDPTIATELAAKYPEYIG